MRSLLLIATFCGCGNSSAETTRTIALRTFGSDWERIDASCDAPTVTREMPFETAVIIEDSERLLSASFGRWEGGSQITVATGCEPPSEPGALERFLIQLDVSGAPFARAAFTYTYRQPFDSAPPDPDVFAPGSSTLTSLEPQDLLAVSTNDWGGTVTDRFILQRGRDVSSRAFTLDFDTDAHPITWRDIAATTSTGAALALSAAVEFRSAGGARMRFRFDQGSAVPTIGKEWMQIGDSEILTTNAGTVDLGVVADGPINLQQVPPVEGVTCAWSGARFSLTGTSSTPWDSLDLHGYVASAAAHTEITITQQPGWPAHALEQDIDFETIPGWNLGPTRLDTLICDIHVCSESGGIQRCAAGSNLR